MHNSWKLDADILGKLAIIERVINGIGFYDSSPTNARKAVIRAQVDIEGIIRSAILDYDPQSTNFRLSDDQYRHIINMSKKMATDVIEEAKLDLKASVRGRFSKF